MGVSRCGNYREERQTRRGRDGVGEDREEEHQAGG